MQTEEDEVLVTFKKKNDKGLHSNDSNSSSADKTECKKAEKSDGEDPKPRIVLTFRSEKSGAKNSNMKIVPNDEKHDEISPRRSSRTRARWEWSDDGNASVSPRKEKYSSQSVSENDETSDSNVSMKRSTRKQSKDVSDNPPSNSVVKKEKSSSETPGPTQRLSRRIKPTAKILANEELRMGLESRNNVRLGMQPEKLEEGVRTRRSARPSRAGPSTSKSSQSNKTEVVTIEVEDENEDDDQNSDSEAIEDPSAVMKLKHLCELGLKAIDQDSNEEESEDDLEVEVEDDEIDVDESEEDEEVDDDSEEVISKLLEADEDSSEDFSCTVGTRKSNRPRRSTRISSTVRNSVVDTGYVEDSYYYDKEYSPPRKRNRSSRRNESQAEPELEEENSSTRRHKNRSTRSREEVHSEVEQEDNISETAVGDDATEAACPEDDATVSATCFCVEVSNVYAASGEFTDPVFCQAVETVEGVRVGCSHQVGRAGALPPLRRAGPRASYRLHCKLHSAQLSKHMCCPACGLFCTQGIFNQCSEGHLYHVECGLPYGERAAGCPHCGVLFAQRWRAANTNATRVRVNMRCGNKRVFLPDQREQCTPAYLSFSTLDPCKVDMSPLIPENLLPASISVDIKKLTEKMETADNNIDTASALKLYEAILAMESIEELIPKIAACGGAGGVNEPLPGRGGGAGAHAAGRRGHVAALHALRCAGAALDAQDNGLLTPLMAAIHTLIEKSDLKNETKKSKIISCKDEKDAEPKEGSDPTEELEAKEEKQEEVVEKDNDKESIEQNDDIDLEKVNEEDLLNVIRYLIAAGCDVNIQGPESMTALHMAAQHGLKEVCSLILDVAEAEVDPRDHGGWTPLVWAAENAHTDVVRLLLSRGADAATLDAEGNGAVHWCALGGQPLALRLLLEAAPHALHLPNAHKDTPLHVAARQGHYACVIILLARGARTDVENSAGELPVEVCSGACRSACELNMQMALLSRGKLRRDNVLASDISNGREPFPVPVMNEVDATPPPDDFVYVTDNVMPEPVAIDNSMQTMQGCACKDDCSKETCACGVLSVRRWMRRGRLPPGFPYHDPPMLFECNQTCGCNARKCTNRTVQRLISAGSLGARVEVFRTERKGWGLRAAETVHKGTPLAVYCGELLALPAADARQHDCHMFALDLKPDLMQQSGLEELLCIDAHSFGSAARFVNHGCAPTAAPLRVFCGARDLRRPCVVLFATAHLAPGDEITFDYGDKFWSVKSKFMKCECGSPDCRYPEKTSESDS